MKRYAYIDNCSGYIWGLQDATTPQQGAKQMDAELGERGRQYDLTDGPAFSNETGYHVHVVPMDLDIADGQDEDVIKVVSALPYAGYLRVTASA
ncbi:hypothetical protein ANK1_2783 [plant metagenome]|uniref:Uncharacterized protein n=1 Tax=plant metagenome TaxID=1297885 RepID=A0A484S6X6_9ZZZZ